MGLAQWIDQVFWITARNPPFRKFPGSCEVPHVSFVVTQFNAKGNMLFSDTCF